MSRTLRAMDAKIHEGITGQTTKVIEKTVEAGRQVELVPIFYKRATGQWEPVPPYTTSDFHAQMLVIDHLPEAEVYVSPPPRDGQTWIDVALEPENNATFEARLTTDRATLQGVGDKPCRAISRLALEIINGGF